MAPDCYKVEVLYCLNPHLVWVEVRDDGVAQNEFKFEQIGIYGVLPLETTIDLEGEEFRVQRCKEWLPAATSLIQQFLNNEEVWFSPTHIDRRSSIFDDNIHKFGDLLIKKPNGKTKSLSKLLRTSGFATYDSCLFHQCLSAGNIKTKLSNKAAQEVIRQIEKYYLNKKVPKKNWEVPMKKQTSVFRASIELETSLTKENVDKHNQNVKALLENKQRDMDLCKGVDEQSVGRASSRLGKKDMIPVVTKLESIKANKNDSKTQDTHKNQEYKQAFEETKAFVEANATPEANQQKISNKTDAHKAQILRKIMCKSGNKVSKQELLVKRLINESKDKTNKEIQAVEPVNKSDDSSSQLNQSGTSTSSNAVCESETPPKNLVGPKQSNVSSDHEQAKKVVMTVSKIKDITKKGPDVTTQINSFSDNSELVQVEVAKDLNSNQIETHKRDANVNDSSIAKGAAMNAEVKTSDTQINRHSKVDRNKIPPANSKPSSSHTNGQNSGAQSTSTASRQKNVPAPISTLPNQNQSTSKQEQRVPDPHPSTDPPKFRTNNNNRFNNRKINALMEKYKLYGSKNSDIIKKAINKCNNGKNVKAAVDDLTACKNRLRSEIKELKQKQNNNDDFCPNEDPQLAESAKKLKKKGKKGYLKRNATKTVYAPPGIDLTKLNCRVPPLHLYEEEHKRDEIQNGSTTNKTNGDSNLPTPVDAVNEPVPSCSYDPKTRNKNDRKDTSSSSSSLLERRLKLHKEMAKNKRYATNSSDTTSKDSSNTEEQKPQKSLKTTEAESDESITDIMEMLTNSLNTNNVPAINDKDTKPQNTVCQQVAINANPFQNFDPNISVFVENLVTPIMLVHSKMNKRFVPTSLFRDINFSDHIRLVLKNLRISFPMMLQTITWPAILRGYSVFMVGPASCGKTMGYLPAVCRLVTDGAETTSEDESVGPICIIVCATSHSVSEVEKLSKMLLECEEKVVSCYYGYDELSIATSLLNGCDLLITTAPSLVRLLQMPEFGVDLRRLATFVLDDCERLSEVYLNELKFSFIKIKEMLKTRVNKELKVQHILASRKWCDFMEPLAKSAPDTVVCIGAFQECVLYASTNMTVSYVKKEDKLDRLVSFLDDIDPSKRTVVVCDSDREVEFLNSAIQSLKYFVFATHSKMTVQDLYNLSVLWREFEEPMMAPVLICRDSNLYHMNVVNAHYLVQYSMPPLYSTFCRRFSTLNDSYPSIFKTDSESVKILILLEENNVEQFPKIINFLKRCSSNIPDFVDDVCKNVLSKKDAQKAECFAPLCNNLLTLGSCVDVYNCQSRHTVHNIIDKPKDWMPTSGVVSFEILHFHSAAHYSARLIANGGEKYASHYSSVSLKMGVHFSNMKNRILFGVPKLGDICAVSLRNHLYARCQVIKIIDRYQKGDPRNVLVNLLDEELIESTTDTSLYHLPDDLKDFNTYVVQVRLANIQPRDKDVVFSELACDQIKEVVDQSKGIHLKGKIVLAVGNCIFVDTLEVCQDLKSLNETVVTYNVKNELLQKHAEVNIDHIPKIKDICSAGGLDINVAENTCEEIVKSVKETPEIRWAFLDFDEGTVYFRSAKNPETLFVRLTKFDDCFKMLIKDIQKYADTNAAEMQELNKGDIVLAKYPDDSLYERARIDEIDDVTFKCFFVDQGEWWNLTKDKFKPINDKLITQLPFQAIECRLVAIKPAGDEWSEFSTNWLYDKCFENHKGQLKQLYAKCLTKEKAKHTAASKYGILLIDTYGNDDVIINQEMIDLNLAKPYEEEIKFLDCISIKRHIKDQSSEDEDDWEKISKSSLTSNNSVGSPSTANILLTKPIRSVPLVETDDDSDDSQKWNINMTDELANIFRPLIQNSAKNVKVTEVQNDEPEDIEQIDLSSLAKNVEECSRHFQLVKINPDTKELDSDDLSSPENSPSATESEKNDPKPEAVQECQLRKPKLVWRQSKASVMIKIQLIGADNYNLEIEERKLKFAATVNDTEYGFEFDLYGVIDIKTATHSNKGQYILIKFDKILRKIWLTLTKDGGIRKWIVYDVDSIDTSSDEEEVKDDNLVNIVKKIHYNSESDSDDEFVDDVNYKYKANE